MKKSLMLVAAVVMMATTAVSCGSKNDAAKENAIEEMAEEPAGEEAVVDDYDFQEIPSDGEGEMVEVEETEEVSASDANVDVDALLNKYEATVNKLIELYGKIKDGDYAAAAQVATMTSDIQTLVSELDAAKTHMSAAQLKRMADIAQKALDATK